MTNTYAPTVNPGDNRVRTHALLIRIPNWSTPSVEIHEEEVLRQKDGFERPFPMGCMTVSLPDTSVPFPLRNPETDELIGGTATIGEAMLLIYSWVRQQQLERDQANLLNQPQG